MPKNKGKGGKNRKKGKNVNDVVDRELIFKEDGQEYGVLTKVLGGGHVEVQCMDGKRRLCHIRGKMHKKVWLTAGDLVLIGLRLYQDSRADVIMKYTSLEASNLRKYGELQDTMRVTDVTSKFEDEDDAVQFVDQDQDSDCDQELLSQVQDLSLV